MECIISCVYLLAYLLVSSVRLLKKYEVFNFFMFAWSFAKLVSVIMLTVKLVE